MDVVTMLAFIGDVTDRPYVYRHWFVTIPKNPAAAKRIISFTGICSRLTKNEVSQKSRAPPATRNDTMCMPSMPCVMASLPNGAISPQKAQAMNIETCAMIEVRLALFIYNPLLLLNFSAKVQTIREK
jgi:hypothetical protein